MRNEVAKATWVFHVSLVLHVRSVRWERSRAVELLFDWGKLHFDWWIVKEHITVGDKVSRDSV